jgi:hypothetical protein
MAVLEIPPATEPANASRQSGILGNVDTSCLERFIKPDFGKNEFSMAIRTAK